MAKLSQIKVGSTTYDLGVQWSNINNIPSTFTPSSHTHDYITYKDTRAVNETPDAVQAGLSVHLKTNGTDGISDGGSYHGVLNVKDWGDYSGGPYWQATATSNNNMYFRRSTSGTAWGSWQKLLSDNNYSSYAVTLSTAQTISGTKTMTGSLKVSGRYAGGGDDEGIIVGFASNGYAGLTLGGPSEARSVFYFTNNGNKPFWRYNNGSTSYDIAHPAKSGTIALTSDIPTSMAWSSITGKPSTFSPSSHTHSYLSSLRTVSGNNHAEALKNEFTNYKSSVPRNSLLNYYSSAMSNGSYYMGYFLSGYDSNPYGGFYVAHYGTPYYVGISSGSFIQSQLWKSGDSVTGAVWNDYAECRESHCDEPGYVLTENGDDTLSKTTERLQGFAGISSDTWGFSQGETEKAKTHIAVAGRVLAYTYRDRNEYKPNDCVCAAPGGTVDIMTREEVIDYPDRIVGTVSCVPDYEEWGGGNDRDPVKVNGRIWIKVK